MIHFTADPHLNHPKIITYCHRPFKDAEQMGEVIKANWNSRVSEDDTIYVIGDVMFVKKNDKRSPELVMSTLSALKGKKVLICGNHDQELVRNCPVWESVHDDLRTSINGQFVHMYHYPCFSWDRTVHGSWMIHGHCHNGLKQYEMYKSIDWNSIKMEDVGVDAWGFRPVSFYELKDRMDRRGFSIHEIDWKNATNNIPDAECIDGTTYWISARNAMLGVYRRKTQSFLILRNKLGHEYVDQEFHWDCTGIGDIGLNGTAMPLQRLERCPVKIGDDNLPTEELKAYLREAETRLNVERYAELVWAVRHVALTGTLRPYGDFKDEEMARRFMNLVRLDIRRPEVVAACGEWTRVEMTVASAMRRLKHGITVGQNFFDDHVPSYGEFLRRVADCGQNDSTPA